MLQEVELLRERNEELRSNCVDSYLPVKQLPIEFQDYEPAGVKIEGALRYPKIFIRA